MILIQLRPQCGRNCLPGFLNLFLAQGRFYFFYSYCSYRIIGCYLQKKSKEILLIQSPTSADYLSVCSFWKHIGKNGEQIIRLIRLFPERPS